jgi:hypothetical protein
MSLGDLVHTREAAKRQVDSLNLSRQRVGIFTTSGNQMLGFTADLDRIHATMMAITTGRASAERVASATVCPETSYYMGDLIVNKHDRTAKGVMIAEAIAKCDYKTPEMAEQMVELAARTAVFVGENATEISLDSVRMPHQPNVGNARTAQHCSDLAGFSCSR